MTAHKSRTKLPGLDPADAVACQPLKTAWRTAEAIVKADLDARARGEEAETEKVMTEAARKRIDEVWDGHYHISFPPTWVPANSTLGAVKRQLETRAAATMEVHKVKCLVEREAKADTIVFKLKRAAGTLRQEKLTEEQQMASIWEFLYKHRTLMLAYAMAAAPEWASADLSLLLEYHEYVISKALETDWGKGLSCEASGRWMLYLRQNSDKSFSDAVMYHRSQSAFLWTGIHNASVAMNVAGRSSRPRSKSRRRSRTRSQKREQWSKRDKGDAFRLETRTQKGETTCTFFNKGKCVKGAQCPMAHVCNYSGCFSSTHARVQQHPVAAAVSGTGTNEREVCTSAHAPALTVSGQEQAKRAALKAAIGDQPRGAGFKPLIEEGCGPRLFVQTLKRLQHPADNQLFSGQGCSRL